MPQEYDDQGLTAGAVEDTVDDEAGASGRAEGEAEDGEGRPDGEDLDFAALLAETEAEIDADAEAEELDEAGPAEEGELADEESGDDDLKDEAGEAPAKEPAEESKGRQEIAELRELAKTQQAQIAALVDVLREGRGAPKEKLRARPEADLTDDDLKVALFGSAEDLKGLSDERRSKAFQAARRRMDDEVRYFRDPAARYKEQLRDSVLEDFFSLTQPLLEDFHERKVRQLIQENLAPIKDPTVRKRAQEIYLEAPGSQAGSWEERRKAMSLAAKAARLEAVDRVRDQKRQKKRARKVQAQASGGGKLQGTAKQGKGARASGFRDLKPGESLMEYAREIEEGLADE